jgi:diguanylate cyclase (GGDEF)-like protein
MTSPDRLAVDPERDINREFWLGHIRIGLGVFVGETVAVMGYLGVTPRGHHRAGLWVMAVSWLAFGFANFLFAPKLASKPWRAHFSMTWTILAAVLIGAAANLDGGLNSPIVPMLFLSVAYGGLAFTPWAAGACGLASLGSAAFVVMTGPAVGMSLASVCIFCSVLTGATVLSVAASRNRVQREKRERVLVARVAELAATDGLTGCLVHRVFYQRLEEEIARSLRGGQPLSLMILDVDHFKSVNDTYGHLAGDRVLAEIGAKLQAHLRRSDIVGRVGGDEFAVASPDTEPSAAITLAERLRRGMADCSEAAVTLSIGVSALDTSAPTLERMLGDADIALYQAKEAGRDGVVAHCAELGPEPSARQRPPAAWLADNAEPPILAQTTAVVGPGRADA